MKKTFICVIATLVALSSNSQEAPNHSESEVIYEQCSNFYKTPPLRDLLQSLIPVDDETVSANAFPKPLKMSRFGDWDLVDDRGLSETGGVDPVLQSNNGTATDKGFRMAINILGQYGLFPPDPTGAVGHDYYVQAVNLTYSIYNKDGSTEYSSHNLNTLSDRTGNGDPIVMYDRFAERWFISQFYGEPDGTDNGVLIAISETADPLGAYYSYEFSYALFPDYPKYSVWSNSYFMSANSTSADCSAFEREKMLVGDPTAGVIKMTFPPMYLLFNSVAPTYAEGPTEPDANSPCYFIAIQDNSYPGVTEDHLKILRAYVNWDAPETSGVTIHQELATASFDSELEGTFGENITQKGTTQKLDGFPGVIMYRVQYRRWAGYNTIVLCHSVNIGGGISGLRWYELRDHNDGIWEIHQQSTYAPDTDNNRWLGSIAMDAQGNIAMAYSFAGEEHFAGLRYTGRFVGDPLGEMTVPEQIGIEGEDAQTTAGRYGDYSQMSMDPTDDMTFWFTGEYLGIDGARKTRIFSFSSWHLSSLEENFKPVSIFNAFQPSPNVIKLTWKNIIDKEIIAEVRDMQGRLILSEELNTLQEEHSVHLTNITNGIFIVTLLGENTNLSKHIYIGK